jgi:hypothetical protein
MGVIGEACLNGDLVTPEVGMEGGKIETNERAGSLEDRHIRIPLRVPRTEMSEKREYSASRQAVGFRDKEPPDGAMRPHGHEASPRCDAVRERLLLSTLQVGLDCGPQVRSARQLIGPPWVE